MRVFIATTVAYLYDGDGRKVEDSGGASGTRIYVYDTAGQVVEETGQNGAVLNEYLYFGGSRMARVQALGPVYYYYADHLGTSRLITDSTGTVCYDADYFPWGGEQDVYVNTCPQNYKFTGKERDPDMGVDYFGARFYHYTMARFYSPDWSAKIEPVPYSKLDDPQSLNLYAYVRNNPLSRTDPDGHEVDLDKNAKKLLLKNVSKAERKEFQVTKDADGKSVLSLKPGADANFKGDHTVGYNRLTTAINSDKVETLNVSKTYTDAAGVSHDVGREYGGGVTLMSPNGNSTIYVSPSGNPYPLTGTNGQQISDPQSIIMGHETLGHGLENALGGDTSQHRAIEIENQLSRPWCK